MSTIVAVYRKHGFCVGLCGGHCYDAKQPSELKEVRRDACECICGGANHGVGLAKALQNRERGVGLRPADLESFAKIKGFACEELTVVDRLNPEYRTAYMGLKQARRQAAPAPVGEDDLFYELDGEGLRIGRLVPADPGGA